MVLLMLAILLAQAASGLFADDEIATQGPLAAKVSNALVSLMSAVHSYNQWIIAGAVALHVIAIATYRWALRMDLVGPMWHGWKVAPVEMHPPAPEPARLALAAALLAVAAGFVYWLVVLYPKA
jgi:cytochrome b